MALFLPKELRKELPEERFRIVAINVDRDPQKGLDFLKKHPVGYVSATDSARRFGVYGVFLGSVWFALGTPLVKRAAFPLGYLLFAIPPPAFLRHPPRWAWESAAPRRLSRP